MIMKTQPVLSFGIVFFYFKIFFYYFISYNLFIRLLITINPKIINYNLPNIPLKTNSYFII